MSEERWREEGVDRGSGREGEKEGVSKLLSGAYPLSSLFSLFVSIWSFFSTWQSLFVQLWRKRNTESSPFFW